MKTLDEIDGYPLYWPPARKRTPAGSRHQADFGRMEWNRNAAGERTYRTRRTLTTDQARRRLMDELGRPGTRKYVVSTNMRLRLDGEIRASQADPADPGVAVYFDHGGKQMCIAIDLWDRVADNLAAVAKSIEAIRGLDRWGGGQMVSAAFAGFKALPGGDALVTPAPMTVEEAAAVVRDLSGAAADGVPKIIADETAFAFNYRLAAKRHHPDTNGGTQLEGWDRLQQAKAVLDRHHEA